MSNVNKLVAVFGVNVILDAVYTADQVTYKDGATSVSFPLGVNNLEAKKPGTYKAELTTKPLPEGAEEQALEYVVTETFVEAPKAVEAAPVVKPKTKQTPAFGYETKERC